MSDNKIPVSIIGICLVAAEHDSYGNVIEPYSYYFVEKLPNGMLTIVKDTNKSGFDWILKINNQLN